MNSELTSDDGGGPSHFSAESAEDSRAKSAFDSCLKIRLKYRAQDKGIDKEPQYCLLPVLQLHETSSPQSSSS